MSYYSYFLFHFANKFFKNHVIFQILILHSASHS